MNKLFYLRHGLSELNIKYLFCGSTDSSLSDIGRQEALLAGEKLKNSQLVTTIKFSAIYSSPLSRAKETAELFTKGASITEPKIIIEPLLTERDFGSLEGTRYNKERSQQLLNDNLPEGVEPWDEVIDRAKKLLDKVEGHDGNVLLVGHGSIGRALKKAINDKHQKQLNWREHIANSTLIQLI